MADTIFYIEPTTLSDAVNVWKIELENSRKHAKSLAIELHDLQTCVQEAIQEITANAEYLSPAQRVEADKNNYLAYHKGINDGHESALKILRKHTGGTVL